MIQTIPYEFGHICIILDESACLTLTQHILLPYFPDLIDQLVELAFTFLLQGIFLRVYFCKLPFKYRLQKSK